MKKTILIFALAWAFITLLFCWINGTFDANQWEGGSKIGYMLITFTLLIITTIFSITTDK